jgi:hypothetical protein
MVSLPVTDLPDACGLLARSHFSVEDSCDEEQKHPKGSTYHCPDVRVASPRKFSTICPMNLPWWTPTPPVDAVEHPAESSRFLYVQSVT